MWTVSDDSLALSFYLLKVASILSQDILALLYLKSTESGFGSTEKARPSSATVIKVCGPLGTQR